MLEAAGQPPGEQHGGHDPLLREQRPPSHATSLKETRTRVRPAKTTALPATYPSPTTSPHSGEGSSDIRCPASMLDIHFKSKPGPVHFHWTLTTPREDYDAHFLDGKTERGDRVGSRSPRKRDDKLSMSSTWTSEQAFRQGECQTSSVNWMWEAGSSLCPVPTWNIGHRAVWASWDRQSVRWPILGAVHLQHDQPPRVHSRLRGFLRCGTLRFQTRRAPANQMVTLHSPGSQGSRLPPHRCADSLQTPPKSCPQILASLCCCLSHPGLEQCRPPHCLFPFPTSPHSPPGLPRPPVKCALCAPCYLWVFLLSTCFIIWHVCF